MEEFVWQRAQRAQRRVNVYATESKRRFKMAMEIAKEAYSFAKEIICGGTTYRHLGK